LLQRVPLAHHILCGIGALDALKPMAFPTRGGERREKREERIRRRGHELGIENREQRVEGRERKYSYASSNKYRELKACFPRRKKEEKGRKEGRKIWPCYCVSLW
jgi:hypothetical protein